MTYRRFRKACLAGEYALLFFGLRLLFAFPREDPLIWALVMVLYPLLSVYPQELIFRGFVFHRYATVFGDGARMAAASAVAFGLVHIAFGRWMSVAMTIGCPARGWTVNVVANPRRRTQRSGRGSPASA